MDSHVGIQKKYHVARVDGGTDPGQKHENCFKFVLDLDHDPHAPIALLAYADDCAITYPTLSDELKLAIRERVGAPLKMLVEKTNEWKEIIIDGLVVNGIFENCHENIPRKAIADLIEYELRLNIDPRVSKPAQLLYANGKKQGAIETMIWCLPISFIIGFATCLYLAGKFS